MVESGIVSLKRHCTKENKKKEANENCNTENEQSRSNSPQELLPEDSNGTLVSSSKRKNKTSYSECMTRHKRKLKRMKDQRDTLQKVQLVNTNQLDSNARKYVFTSSLELVSTTDAFSKVSLEPTNSSTVSDDKEENPTDLLSLSGKCVAVYTCKMCEKIYNSKKILLLHQKKHLKCTICKKQSSTLKEHENHFETTCYGILTKNLPIVQLKRVDKDAQIVAKYSRAFEALQPKKGERDSQTNSEVKNGDAVNAVSNYGGTNILNDNANHKPNTWLLGTHPSGVVTKKHQWMQTPVELEKFLLEQNCSVYKEEEENVVETKVLTYSEDTQENNSIRTFVHKNGENVASTRSALVVNSTSSHNIAGIHDKDKIIRLLFNKYKKQHEIKDAATTASLPRKSEIAVTPQNVIIYKNLQKHLAYCNIPVSFMTSNKVFTSYYVKNYVPQVKQPPRFNWSNLNCRHFIPRFYNNINQNILVINNKIITNQNNISSVQQRNEYVSTTRSSAIATGTASRPQETVTLCVEQISQFPKNTITASSSVQSLHPSGTSSLATESHLIRVHTRSSNRLLG